MSARWSWGSRWRQGLGALAAAGLFALAAAHVDHQTQQRHAEETALRLTHEVATRRALLEAHLNARLHAVEGLVAYAQSHPDPDPTEFALFAAALRGNLDGIRALQLAPRGVVRLIWPMAGNEAAMGHDLLADPLRREAVLRAIEQRCFVLTGPFELIQGGKGLVGRRPVFLDGGGFWGLAIVVLDLDPVLAAAGFDGRLGWVRLALRGSDANGREGAVFYGDPAVFDHAGVAMEVSLPGGSWQLAGVPAAYVAAAQWPGRRLYIPAAIMATLLIGGAAFAIGEQAVRLRRSAGAARAAAGRFRAIFDQTFQLIGTLTPAGVVTDLNGVAAELGGGKAATLGRPLWEAEAWGDDPRQQAALRGAVRAAADGATARFEGVHRRPDGVDGAIAVAVKPIHDAAGRIPELLVEMRDVTAERRAERHLREREELYRQTFAANAAVTLLIEPASGGIVEANGAAAAYYGIPVDRLKGMAFAELGVLPEPAVLAELAAVRDGGRRRARLQQRRDGGELRNIEMYAGPLELQGRVLINAIMHDVTQRDRFEEELTHSNRELEQFAYVASHDLRAPLRAIQSFLQLLKRRYDDRLDQDGREFIGFAIDGAERMDRLVAEILEYSRIGRSDRPLVAVELGPLVERVLGLLRPEIEATGGTVLLPEGGLPCVLGDPTELERLLVNLIGNAVKYRAEDRPPRVILDAERQGPAWRLSVADNGVGIAPEDYDTVFLAFKRLAATAGRDGTGIGLAVAKKIVERHGGRIWVTSTPGEGSCFHFTLNAA